MLVLSRKQNESIVIGDNLTVAVVGIRGDRVMLGISAPKEVSILRKELTVARLQEPIQEKSFLNHFANLVENKEQFARFVATLEGESLSEDEIVCISEDAAALLEVPST